jgi:hypothetical protein
MGRVGRSRHVGGNPLPELHHCHMHPRCVWQADAVVRTLHGVIVPVQVDEVDCQRHPGWVVHMLCDVNVLHAVSVPVHGTVVVDQLHPCCAMQAVCVDS